MRQEGGGLRRRWFQDDGMELIMWYDQAGASTGYQICYVAPDRRERALTWRPEGGFAHEEILSGGTRPDKNMTPILVKNGAVPWSFIREEFERRSVPLEKAVRNQVLETLGAREA